MEYLTLDPTRTLARLVTWSIFWEAFRQGMGIRWESPARHKGPAGHLRFTMCGGNIGGESWDTNSERPLGPLVAAGTTVDTFGTANAGGLGLQEAVQRFLEQWSE
jgi:hypothetical protein